MNECTCCQSKEDPENAKDISRRAVKGLREISQSSFQAAIAVLALIVAVFSLSGPISGQAISKGASLFICLLFITLSLIVSSLTWLFTYLNHFPRLRLSGKGVVEALCVAPLVVGVGIFGYLMLVYLYRQS